MARALTPALVISCNWGACRRRPGAGVQALAAAHGIALSGRELAMLCQKARIGSDLMPSCPRL
jgi:hypothetical protein